MKYALGNMLNGAGGLNADGLSLDLQFATDKTLTARKGPTPVFTRASSGTFVGSDGLIQSAAINAARFDHDPITLVCKGLLIEEQRTNLVFPSDTLTTQTRTVTAVAHTLSFYGTGTVVLSGVAIATVTGTGAYPTRTTLTFTPTAGSLIMTVTGSVTQAQLESGAFPTSYIPTTAASVVRSADVCSITGSDFPSFYSTTGSTFFSEFDSSISTGEGGVVTLDGPGGESYILYINGADAWSVTQNVDIIAVSSPARTANVFKKIASSEDPVANNFSLSYGGSDAAFLGASNNGALFSDLKIGANPANSLNGHIKFLRHYKKALSNSKIKLLTTP